MDFRFPVSQFLPLLMMAAALNCGCSMTSTTFLTRDESNLCWQTLEKADGIPITVKVPTHLKVYVYHKHFLEVVTVGGVKEVRFMDQPPLKDYAHELIYTDLVALVDFKHPAAKHLSVELNEEQYLKSFHERMEEDLVERAENLIATLPVGDDPAMYAPLAPEIGCAAPVGEIDQLVREVKSVAAVGVFEIHAPDFEQQVMAFLEFHFNGPGILKPIGSPPLLPAPPYWNEDIPSIPPAEPMPIITPAPPQPIEQPLPEPEPEPEMPPVPMLETRSEPIVPAIPQVRHFPQAELIVPAQEQHFIPPVVTQEEEFEPPAIRKRSSEPLELQVIPRQKPSSSLTIPLPQGHQRLELPGDPPEEAFQMPISVPQPVQHSMQTELSQEVS